MPRPKKDAPDAHKQRRLALFWKQSLQRIPIEARREHWTYLHGALMEIATDYIPQFVPAENQAGAYTAIMAMVKNVASSVIASDHAPAQPLRQVFVPVLPNTQQQVS